VHKNHEKNAITKPENQTSTENYTYNIKTEFVSLNIGIIIPMSLCTFKEPTVSNAAAYIFYRVM
jgi:hypothetical protein